MQKSFKRLALILIVVLALAAIVVPASAYDFQGEPPPGESLNSLPARCGSSC